MEGASNNPFKGKCRHCGKKIFDEFDFCSTDCRDEFVDVMKSFGVPVILQSSLKVEIVRKAKD